MKSFGKSALITGGSQGLGRALAEECAGRGMDLVLVALPETGLGPLAEILRRAYEVRIETVEMDLTDPASVGNLRTLVQEKGFRIDVLINNAGVGFTSRFEEASAWQNEATVQLNVAALVRLTQAMLPLLRERPRGWILNVASIGAFYPMPSMPVYSATKTFVLNFSMLLREELRGSSVSVSVLCPNGIRTNRGCRQLIERQGLAGRITCHYPDQVARIALRGLLGRRGVIVPGIINRALRHASPLVPRAMYMKMIARRWGTEKRRDQVRPLGAEA